MNNYLELISDIWWDTSVKRAILLSESKICNASVSNLSDNFTI